MLTMSYHTGPGYFTPQTMASALRQFGPKMDVPILVGIDRGLGEARARAINAFLQRGIGRAVFSRKPKGAFGHVKVFPARTSGGGNYVGSLQAVGLAAIQDRGGRTAPHDIPKSARNKVLALKGGGFVNVKNEPLHHPGASHPAMPFMENAIEASAPRVALEIEREMERLAAQLSGGRAA